MIPQRLKRLVQSIQFGIAIEQGHSAMAILEAMTSGDGLTAATAADQRPASTVGRALKLALLDFRMFTGTGAQLALRFLDLHRRKL